MSQRQKAVCGNLQYSENVNMPDSPGWKWVQTVQTETADRYLIRLKSREEGRARKTYRVEVKGRYSGCKECAQCDTDCASATVASAVGDYFAGLRYSLTSLNPQDDLQLVLILTVIAAILGLRIWLIQRKADKTLRYFLMTRIINAPGNRNRAYAEPRSAPQTRPGDGRHMQKTRHMPGTQHTQEKTLPVRWRWKNRKSGSGWRSGTCRRRTGVTAACRQSHLRHLHWGIIFLYAIAYRFNTSHDTARTMLLMGEAGLYMTLLAL